MRLVLIVAALLGAAPGAHAATVAGELVDGRLELRFRVAPGERNELGMVPGGGRDQLAGGFGPDAIFAGPGNDRIRATDPKGDVIRCGPGRDVAYVSRRDRTTGCERIVLGWPS